jgi:prepilin-type processing-associated H-X9-DG protein/prepilin-type N-terminal cleavage/methylation domain-containing protein
MNIRKGSIGFTLVELLVVVGIIALLIGITMPALNVVRARAEGAQCKGHLKQIGTAMNMYVADHYGNFPAVELDSGDPGNSWDADVAWPHMLSKYVGHYTTAWWEPFSEDNVFWGCPAWEGIDEDGNIPPVGQVVESSTGYGMNTRLKQPESNEITAEEEFPVDRISFPDKRALICDAPDYRVSASATYGSTYHGFSSSEPGSPRRHGEEANYLFCDLHVDGASYTNGYLHLYDPATAPSPDD